MALEPFTPYGAVGDKIVLSDGGIVWALESGGWAFQYPNMALRVTDGGHTQIAWANPQYAMEFNKEHISYKIKDTAIHRSTEGGLVYHSPIGTIHQKGETLIYHWCEPNFVVYQSPSGIVYYGDDGMTYRGIGGIAHYARNGEMFYQGVGGITQQNPDGALMHWTNAGVLYRLTDGTLLYTAVGESTPKELDPSALGPDPFPGGPLSAKEVRELAKQAYWPYVAPSPAPAPFAWPMDFWPSWSSPSPAPQM